MWVKVFAPATIGNIGPGFDVLGVAVDSLGDTIEVRKIESGVKITEITGDNGELPRSTLKNTAGIAAREVLKLLKVKGGVEIKLHKNLPSASGLGSSAASAAAAAFATNYLYGGKLSKKDLILPATIAESRVSGGFFADNTAPSLLGGATLTRSCEPLDVVELGSISDLIFVLAIPKFKLLTKKARKVLPKKIYLKDFVFNMANSCLVAAAFSHGDYGLLARCINDRIIEPARAPLIPGFYDVKKAALKAGADGCTISGAGPTVFAITNDSSRAEKIGTKMKEAFRKNGLECRYLVSKVCRKGAYVVR